MEQIIQKVFLPAWCVAAAFATTVALSVWTIVLTLFVKAVRSRNDDQDDDAQQRKRRQRKAKAPAPVATAPRSRPDPTNPYNLPF